MHYTKHHFCCHLCDRAGVANKWFKDYHGLDVHFGDRHWPCHEAACKERRFVAFEDEFQLQLHMQEAHRKDWGSSGGKRGGARLTLSGGMFHGVQVGPDSVTLERRARAL